MDCLLPFWSLVASPRSASLRLWAPVPGGAACALAREGAATGRAGAGPAAGRVRSGRAGARSRRAGPVSAAPCPQHGRREAQGARWPGRGGAAFPAAAAPAWAARSSGSRAGAGRRPRAAAARGPTDGKGRGSCQRVAGPLRWRNLLFLPRLAGALLSLSLSLTLSLPGWKFPLTSREKDRRTHALTQRGREVGSQPGVGEARTSGGAVRPRPGLGAQLGSRPRGRLGAQDWGRARRRGRSVPCGAPGALRAAAVGDAPGKRPWSPSVPGSRRRGR